MTVKYMTTTSNGSPAILFEVDFFNGNAISGDVFSLTSKMQEYGFFSDNEATYPSEDDFESETLFLRGMEDWFSNLPNELICRGKNTAVKISKIEE
jgi:hypothetical protein